MSGGRRWDRAKKNLRPYEQAHPTGGEPAGPWSHVKREPVRTYTAAEIAAFMAKRKESDDPGQA